MDNGARALALALASAVAVGTPVSAADPALPVWAYPVNPPGTQPAPDDGRSLRVPGSPVSFTLTQIRDLFKVPDWHPGDHPAMPEPVANGRKPGVFACGYCHLPNGLGRPENSSLAGLPAEYIVQQVADFKSGARRSSEPDSLPINLMTAVAKAATDAEVQGCRRLLLRLETEALDPGGRIRHGSQDPCGRLDAGRLRAGRAGTDRPAHHRDAGGSRAHRAA